MSIGFKLAENVFKRNAPVTKSELSVLDEPERTCFFDRLLDICLHSIDDFKTEPNFDHRNIQLRMHHIHGLNQSPPSDMNNKSKSILNHGLDNISAQHVCHRPLNELCEVSIRDLLNRVGVIHKGKYIELKIAEDCFKISGIYSLVEDKRGDVITLGIYNFVDLRASNEDVRKLFPKGVKITLKEPYIKQMASGLIGLRLDNPSNLIIHCSWVRPYLTPLELKEEGNKFVSNDLPKAFKLYSMALENKTDAELRLACLNNRALVSLRAHEYQLALQDSDAALSISESNTKARLRKAMALLGLHRPDEALGILNGLQEHSSEIGTTTLTQAIDRARTNINQRRGIFDFSTLPFDPIQQEEVCDFLGPLEVRMTEHKGRGLFLTKNVKAGDLLLVEKAHAFGVTDENVDFRASDIATSKCLNFQQQELCSRLSLLCNASSYNNAKLALLSSSSNYNQYLPDLRGILLGDFPPAPLLSVAEVQGIASINRFGFNFNAAATPAMRSMKSDFPQFLAMDYNEISVNDANGNPGSAMIADPQNEIMHMAITCNNAAQFAKAIKRASKDDLNCQSPVGKDTALIYAIHQRNEVGAILLIRAGAGINLANHIGMTPLHIAAGPCANERIVKCLIEHGADVNANITRRLTPLQVAVYTLVRNPEADIRKSTRIVELLLNHGADAFAVDHELRSVVDIAYGNEIFHAFTQRAIVPIDYKPPMKKGCGLWIIASFLNHNRRCNTNRSTVGKLMLLYAVKDMKKGTELTTRYGEDPVTLRRQWGIVEE